MSAQEDELQRRYHFIKQLQEIKRLAESAEWALRRENPDDAGGDISELEGRVKAVSEDFEPLDFRSSDDTADSDASRTDL
jgi:hypothetical protein